MNEIRLGCYYRPTAPRRWMGETDAQPRDHLAEIVRVVVNADMLRADSEYLTLLEPGSDSFLEGRDVGIDQGAAEVAYRQPKEFFPNRVMTAHQLGVGWSVLRPSARGQLALHLDANLEQRIDQQDSRELLARRLRREISPFLVRLIVDRGRLENALRSRMSIASDSLWCVSASASMRDDGWVELAPKPGEPGQLMPNWRPRPIPFAAA